MKVTTQQITFSSDALCLNDATILRALLNSFVEEIGLTKVSEVVHGFKPQGYSIVYVLAESHIAIHSWPEEESAYLTVSSCTDLRLTEKESTSIIIKFMPVKNIVVTTIDNEVAYAA